MSDRISREELVRIYNIEITFFDSLEEAGLLKTETENNTTYLRYDELATFEKFTNWHYDLEVNLAGLEVIHHLLHKIEELQHKKISLTENINL
ncbi:MULTISPECIES: chaperone modulator CbpM [unclassified Kaistella]|uniref:chaperone modulator CbpM n=1 Tax=unclassified Kaistella TaxID=2762626 RepID=UPI002734B3F0|nr:MULTISPECIES: chaperone modulator CbpM [unclassified Kaistella]MCZ2083137.1 chaperone modulator CbpM [Flavobacteriales bacterium]MDP2453429.1 chaperone modulator CbpM [Kaistella sp. SH11-4b]MDP2456486.1 chaperone modulator CbpM [Kaistella sp. SH40-3]MDP2459242.1 chaperone modulator CbpM [Kaistella sp. SH19-2b]